MKEKKKKQTWQISFHFPAKIRNPLSKCWYQNKEEEEEEEAYDTTPS